MDRRTQETLMAQGKQYYYLEFLNQRGDWERVCSPGVTWGIETRFMTRAEAMEEKDSLVGSYAEWLPGQLLRTEDVRIRIK